MQNGRGRLAVASSCSKKNMNILNNAFGIRDQEYVRLDPLVANEWLNVDFRVVSQFYEDLDAYKHFTNATPCIWFVGEPCIMAWIYCSPLILSRHVGQ
jgi:hypothetical protein